MSTNQLTEAIERYLNGEMSAEERAHFDQLRKENTEIDNKIAEHLHFTGLLKQYRERIELEKRLNAIHSEIDVHALVEEMTVHPSWVIQMWRNHHSKISVAASVAIFAVLTGMFFAGYFSNRSQPHYQELRDQIENVKRKNDALDHKTNVLANEIGSRKRILSPSNYKGTGFAFDTIVTDCILVERVTIAGFCIGKQAAAAFVIKKIFTLCGCGHSFF